MEIDQGITPLSPLQAQLYPLLALLKRGSAKTVFQLRYYAYVRRVEKRKALRKIAREVGQETRYFEQILTVSLTRMRFAYTPSQDHQTAAGGKKHKVQRVKFEYCPFNNELIYYRIQTRRRGLFGYKNMLPYGTFVTQIVEEETLNELSIACERKVSAIWDSPHKGAWLVVHRLEGAGGIPRLVSYRDMLRHYPADNSKGTIVLGVGASRKVHSFDLATHPHCLIGGQTGGGKSNLVNNFIASQIRFQDSELFKLVLIDLKRMEFSFYKDAPHVLGEVIYDPKTAINHLLNVFKMIQERSAKFDGKVKELSEWNKQYPKERLPRIVTVIDEYAELMLSGSKIARKVTALIARISALGRAAGIHLIICTQRPDAKIVPGLIRMNMGITISGFAPTAIQSQVIIGTGEAANLPATVKGRMIYARGSEKHEIQTPLITDDDVKEAVRIAKGKHAGLIELAPIDPVVIPAGLAKFAVEHTKGSLYAPDIADQLRGYGIDFNMYKNATDELAKQGVIETDKRVYTIVPGEQGYKVEVSGAEWSETETIEVPVKIPEPTTIDISPLPDVLQPPAKPVSTDHPLTTEEPPFSEDDTQDAPIAPNYHDTDHEKMIRKFIREKCETGPTKRVKIRDLYAAYSQWCNENSIEVVINENFGKILKSESFGFRSKQSNGIRYSLGIDLAEVPAVPGVPASVI